jgi:hypothetical protein
MKKPLLVKVTLEGDHIFINIGNAEGGVGYGIPNTPQAIQQEAIQFDANPGQDETVHGITFPAHLKPQVAHDLRKLMPKITLPVYGITIDGSTITSNLKDGDPADYGDDEYLAAVDAIESIVLAHHLAGIDVTSPAYVNGITAAVEGINNNVL